MRSGGEEPIARDDKSRLAPPVFDLDALASFRARVRDVRIPIVAGLLPFESACHADLLANEVPGLCVPPALSI